MSSFGEAERAEGSQENFESPSLNSVSGTVYVGLSADVIHHGHIRLLKVASTYGRVIVGLLTDRALEGHKIPPALAYDQRKEIIEELTSVNTVVPQNEWDYSHNIRKIKPTFFIHGDDWVKGPDSRLRERCIDALNSYGGRLVEVPATPNIESDRLRASYLQLLKQPSVRIRSLKRRLDLSGFCRVIEAHSPLAATLVEKGSVSGDGVRKTFDALWSSSLADSLLAGKPDNEELSLGERLTALDGILDVSSMPVIVDAETGGQIPHLISNCRTMARMGISAVVIEDKVGLKQNSLLGSSKTQAQEESEIFSSKLQAAREAVDNPDFMVVARIESLVLGNGMEDAISRARTYVAAGADALLIHSRSNSPDEVIEFAKRVRQLDIDAPLACVPTTYSSVTEENLKAAGFQIVIYANQLLRASIPAMKNALERILTDGCCRNLEEMLTPIPELFSIVEPNLD